MVNPVLAAPRSLGPSGAANNGRRRCAALPVRAIRASVGPEASGQLEGLAIGVGQGDCASEASGLQIIEHKPQLGEPQGPCH